MGYFEPMRVRTSITVEKELLKTVNKLSRQHKNRSEFIEIALRAYISENGKAAESRDLHILNRHADELNREALDVLDYQAGV